MAPRPGHPHTGGSREVAEGSAQTLRSPLSRPFGAGAALPVGWHFPACLWVSDAVTVARGPPRPFPLPHTQLPARMPRAPLPQTPCLGLSARHVPSTVGAAGNINL